MENLNKVKRVFTEKYYLMENKQWENNEQFDEYFGRYELDFCQPTIYISETDEHKPIKPIYVLAFVVEVPSEKLEMKELRFKCKFSRTDTIYEMQDGSLVTVNSQKTAHFLSVSSSEEFIYPKELDLKHQFDIDVDTYDSLSSVCGKLMNDIKEKVKTFIEERKVD